MFEIKVYGMDLADVESIGGWQTYRKSNSADAIAEMYYNLSIAHGDENVALYVDDVLMSDDEAEDFVTLYMYVDDELMTSADLHDYRI